MGVSVDSQVERVLGQLKAVPIFHLNSLCERSTCSIPELSCLERQPSTKLRQADHMPTQMDVRLHVFQPEDFDLRLGVGRRRMGLVGILVDMLTSQSRSSASRGRLLMLDFPWFCFFEFAGVYLSALQA